MLLYRLRQLHPLILLAILVWTPIIISASVFGSDTSSDPKPAPIARSLTPTKRQASNPGTSQGFGRRSKKNNIPAPENGRKEYSSFLCAAGSSACPHLTDGARTLDGREMRKLSPKEMDAQLHSLADWFRVGFQCVDIKSENEDCGGCAALGAGRNCSAITDATVTSCEQGSCRIQQCADGFTVSGDKLSCVSRPGPAAGTFRFDEGEEQRVWMRR